MADYSNKHSGFYRAFEDQFRGSREVIRSRLEVYKPFLDAVHNSVEKPCALDVGCGRGEWLELLNDNGFEAVGVDVDEPMLVACRERGLSVYQADAIEYICSLGDTSQMIVSGFHIAEHLPFEKLQTLIEQAYRVLKPGGLLILETPNPENFRVSSLTFYLDPTHKHPIPPALLSFMMEYYGFSRNVIMRLQEEKLFAEQDEASLEQVFGWVSPDFSVVAQKQADEDIMTVAEPLFVKRYGLNEKDLFDRFENRRNRVIEKIRNELAVSISEHEEVINKNNEILSADLERHKLFVKDALRVSEKKIRERIEDIRGEVSKVDELAFELATVYQSKSWRVTAPLRGLSRFRLWFARGASAWLRFAPGSRPRRMLKKGILRTAGIVLSRPQLAKPIRFILKRSPVTERLIKGVLLGKAQNQNPTHLRRELPLSPKAQRIYVDIKTAIKNTHGNV